MHPPSYRSIQNSKSRRLSTACLMTLASGNNGRSSWILRETGCGMNQLRRNLWLIPGASRFLRWRMNRQFMNDLANLWHESNKNCNVLGKRWNKQPARRIQKLTTRLLNLRLIKIQEAMQSKWKKLMGQCHNTKKKKRGLTRKMKRHAKWSSKNNRKRSSSARFILGPPIKISRIIFNQRQLDQSAATDLTPKDWKTS